MKIPTEGDRLVAANGTVYVVEFVSEPEPDGFFTIEIADATDASDMQAMGFDLTNEEFELFCKAEGIGLVGQ